jgi:type IV pilus assembly protein PilV
MRTHMNACSGRHSRGFTLVEALVALVVLSIGMLGIAALHVESLRSGRSALLRTQAIVLATDMADRIRANPTATISYRKAENDTGTVTAACNPAGAGCTPAQMAAHDIASWIGVVDDRYDSPAVGRLALPTGRGTIMVDDATLPATYRIIVQWSEAGPQGANSYELRFQI